MDKDKAIRAAKLTAAGILEKNRAVLAKERAGGQIAPSKYLPGVPRQVHAAGGPVADLGQAREQKQLQTFGKNMREDIHQRASNAMAAHQKAVDAGVFEGYEVGDTLQGSAHPMRITARFVRKWKPTPMALQSFDRMGTKPTIIEHEGEQYIPMLRYQTGKDGVDGFQEGDAYLDGVKAAGYQKMGGLRSVKADGGAVGVPQKTVKAYKLFRTKGDGKLYPLFVNAEKPVPMGEWLEAEEGPQGKAQGKVKSKLGDLAYRPGWHAGDLPVATHIGGKSSPDLKKPDYRPDNHVWAEVEMAADKDWQSVADSRGRGVKAHITDQVPLGGFYRYKTNPNMTGNWLIGGNMKVNRVLPDDEVKAINDQAGTADLPRLPRGAFAAGGSAMFEGMHEDLQNEDGTPKELWHGTPGAGFEAFDDAKLGNRDAGFYGRGHYLTPIKGNAEGYADPDEMGSGTVMGPLHAALKNPYVWDTSENGSHRTLRDLQSMGIMKGQGKLEPWDNLQRHHIDPFMREMQTRGHDGVLVKGNNGLSEVVVFKPTAIKHRDAEVFDPNDPRIMRAEGGRIARAPGGYVPQASIAYKSLPVGQAPAIGGGTSLGDFAQMASMMGGKGEAAAPQPQHHQNDGHDHSGMSDAALQAWNKLTDAYGQPLTIVSGYRDPQQNEAAGGAKGSQHLHGNAYDIDTSGMSHEDRLALATQAYNSGFRGFGFYDNNMHFDVGDQRAWGPSYSSDSIPEWAQPFVQQYVARAAGGKVYPTADRSEWYGDANYQSTGGQIEHMSPDEYLSKVRPLDIDEASRDNIDDLKNHIMSGRKLDPLKIDAKGREDGRHRAHAAKELGIKSVPVLTWPRSARANGGPVTDNENFQSWFGNSVTHTDGEPHVFYTGTSKDKDFTAFNVGRHGAWFVRDPEVASSYADQNDSQGYKWEGGRPIRTNTASRVIPAYIKAENPYTGEYSGATTGNYKSDQSNWFDSLRAKGHDAWIPASSQGKLAVVLREPQQIKSIYNNGKFDPNQKHMGKAEGGEVDNNNQGDDQYGKTAPLNPASRTQAGEFPVSGGVRGGSGVFQAPYETSLEGLPQKVSIPLTGGSVSAGHDPRIRQIARDYMASTGMPYNPPTKYAKVDPKRASRIAAAYDDMKDDASDPLTKASYDAMIKETMAQYHAAKNAGFKAEFWNPETDEDPYKASPRLATEDVRNNHHMWVYPTRSGYGSDGPITAKELAENPLLQDSGETWNGQPVTVNDIFRAVHDYYGHAKEGVGFRGDGEENAWRSHASMYSPLARMAMTSETRGQNSWLNYGVHGDKNRNARTEDTIFAPQKIGILPHWAHHEGAEDFMGPEEVRAMAEIHKRYGRATGGAVNKALDLTRGFTKNGAGVMMSLKSKGK